MSDATRVVVVTGLSGAGKSTALHALEDLGYFCVDNLPTALAPQAVDVLTAGGIHRIALGIDVRVRAFLDEAAPALELIRAPASARAPSSPGVSGPLTPRKRDVRVLFLDASDATLLRRYSETRRPHPLTWPDDAPQGPPSAEARRGSSIGVLDGIHLERERLAPLRAHATVDLDTTRLSVHDLRRQVIAHLGPGTEDQPRMVTRFLSFGYKYGIPVDADVMFDVRFLDNPFFVPELRHLPGTDAAVRDYVLALPEAREFVQRVEELLFFTLPRYEREGKAYLTVAVGCTGGRHRSVTLAALLAERASARLKLPITVVHRDVARTDPGSGRGDDTRSPAPEAQAGSPSRRDTLGAGPAGRDGEPGSGAGGQRGSS